MSASKALGVVVEETTPGGAILSMKVRTDMLNGHAVCHGGVIFTLATTALAVARDPLNPVCSTAGCSIDFLAPAKGDDVLTAQAQQIESASGRSLYDVKVTNQHGAVVALCRGSTAGNGTRKETHQE